MARSEISIDFSLPRNFPVFQELGGGLGIYFVPLLVLRKWPPLLRLDLRDQFGNSFPLLTTQKNEAIDAAFLLSSAPSGALRDAAQPVLEAIPSAGRKEAKKHYESIFNLVQAHRPNLTQPERLQWAETMRLAASLGSNMLLWARVEARREQRLIVKVAYENHVAVTPGMRRVFTSLSWAALRLQFVWHDMSGCSSYHVQVEPPDGLEVHRATLRMVSSEQAAVETLAPDRTKTRAARAGELWWAFRNTVKARWWLLRHGPRTEHGTDSARPPAGEPYRLVIDERAYLYVTGVTSRNVGAAEVDLATSRRGLRRAAVGFGLATTAFLGSITAIVPGIVNHVDGAVPALLLTPALLALVIVNPGEHPLVRTQLIGVRLVVATVATLPVAAMLALLSFHGSRPDISTLRWCWASMALVSLVLTIALALSWLLPPVKDAAATLSQQGPKSGED
jgi:hypothetical protein